MTLALFEGLFINPWMLLGLGGLALPILAHLLSKKKFDVVEWGAMQFLELRKNARRRIRLEELLLMALRMGLIALLAIALARPWVSGGLLGGFASKRSRDVVIVIDGSYSMGWEGKAETPHAAAAQWAHEFLEELNSGDTVAILDARDVVRPVIESPTRDFSYVREKLTSLPEPAGSSDLAEAAVRGIQILSTTTNVSRELIVLTDGQSRGWSVDDGGLWARFDDLRQQPAVKPRVWVVDVSNRDSDATVNFAIDALEPSREMTVVGSPVRFKTKVHRTGGVGTLTRRVYFEVDGQRLAERTVAVQLGSDGEATVEIEHKFSSNGSHVVALVLDDDNLPGDNRSQAAVSVAKAIPVLLVDGNPDFDPTRSETFFARAALTAGSNETPWVQSRVVGWEEFAAPDLQDVEVVVLANVPSLSAQQNTLLQEHVLRGGGLLIALGDRIDPAAYNSGLFAAEAGVMPLVLDEIEQDADPDSGGVHVLDKSLELPWLRGLRASEGGGLTDARFSHWWKVTPAAQPADDPEQDERRATMEAARLTNDRPLLLTRNTGRGEAVLMTSSLDADWSTLPAKPDFVSLLHEVVFHLSAGQTVRNVDVGTSLVLPVSEETKLSDYVFVGPDDEEFPAEEAGDEYRRLSRFDATQLPGRYDFRVRDQSNAKRRNAAVEHFIVNFDRAESDLSRLSGEDQLTLIQDERMQFTESMDELKAAMFRDDSRAEFWYFLMLVFLGILVFEVVMTRRLVQGGHEVVDTEIHETEAVVT